MTNTEKDDFTFIAEAGALHHIDYLMPYLQHSHEKKIILFDYNPSNVGEYFKKYPKTSVKYYAMDEEILENMTTDPDISSKKMLINSNYYAEIETLLSNDIFYHVYACHGVPQKLLNTLFYQWFWTYDTSIIFSKKDLIQIANYKNIDISHIGDEKVVLLKNEGREHLFIIGGNQRMKYYQQNALPREQTIQDSKIINPNKKTLLYMPTYDSKQWTCDQKNLCSLDFFCEQIIPNFKDIENYNIIIKCHPTMQADKFTALQLKRLNEAYPNISYSYHGNYLQYMEIADLMLADFTSATYDFLYFDRPIIFIDKFDEVKEVPKIEDIENQYWLYACGEILNSQTVKNFSDLIKSCIEEDTFQKTRQHYKELSFDDSLSVDEVLDACRTHPKY